MASFTEKLIKTVSRRRKTPSKEDEATKLGKLRGQKRLSNEEFWNIYASIRKEGPAVRYPNPDNWIVPEE